MKFFKNKIELKKLCISNIFFFNFVFYLLLCFIFFSFFFFKINIENIEKKKNQEVLRLSWRFSPNNSKLFSNKFIKEDKKKLIHMQGISESNKKNIKYYLLVNIDELNLLNINLKQDGLKKDRPFNINFDLLIDIKDSNKKAIKILFFSMENNNLKIIYFYNDIIRFNNNKINLITIDKIKKNLFLKKK